MRLSSGTSFPYDSLVQNLDGFVVCVVGAAVPLFFIFPEGSRPLMFQPRPCSEARIFSVDARGLMEPTNLASGAVSASGVDLIGSGIEIQP
ncbi:hypothetical protein F2Q70_00044824 [Brassica cretica]|uniref:Uncharacterized protein n=1 Tax=Brassica cretica TaxID=69181 RepID=A0A8S9J1K8_BRACR|nr:hypothetical protein F2Q70_00001114 [Brassica cretica]KAF2593212.1 hypothetical protein F2Q70_00044824 [Brassica cretica]